VKRFHLCHEAAKGQEFAAPLRALKKVRPVLHHLGAWLHMERMVIACAYGVARRVIKL
jgi:hypothetical protein